MTTKPSWSNGKLPKKTFDLIVYGATSSIGKQLVDYLVRNIPPWMIQYWAFADDDREALDELEESMKKLSRNNNQIFPIETLNKISENVDDIDDFDELSDEFPWTLDLLCYHGYVIIDCSGDNQLSELLIQSCLISKSNYIHIGPNIEHTIAMKQKYHQLVKDNRLYFIFQCFWETVILDSSILASWNVLDCKITNSISRISLDTIRSYTFQRDESNINPGEYISLLNGSYYKLNNFNELEQVKLLAKPKFPAFPKYDDSLQHYTIKSGSSNCLNFISLSEKPTNISISETFCYSNHWAIPSIFQIISIYFFFIYIYILCKVLYLYSILKWKQQRKKIIFSKTDYMDTIIATSWTIKPNIEEEEIQIGRESIKLSKDNSTKIDLDCPVFGPIRNIFPASIAACAICLINNKGNLVDGGFGSPGILGPELPKSLQSLGIDLHVNVQEEFN